MILNLDQDQKESFVLFCAIVLLILAMLITAGCLVISGKEIVGGIIFFLFAAPFFIFFSLLTWKIWLFARRKTFDLPPPQPPVKKNNPRVVELAMKSRKPADIVSKRKAACTA